MRTKWYSLRAVEHRWQHGRRWAAVHLAAATPGISPLCELGEFEVISGDPFFGLSVEKGTISVPEGEGLGVGLKGF